MHEESGQLNPEHRREPRHSQVSMAEEETILQITRNLKNAVSAILQGYGDGQGPVTDTSAELRGLCGCLELLLQFDQREQRSFLGARKDYWDFLFTALRGQRGCTEQITFVCSQNKLKTSLGKGRAFIRLCLAHGQLAESMQLCLLSPDLTREWYGPRSPLLCPELQEDILDSLYALNGIAFNLDLQRPDLDEDWPMFSESRGSNPSRTQERRPRKPEGLPKEVSCSRGEQLQQPDIHGTSCLQDTPREDSQLDLPTPLQHGHLPTSLEKKRGDSRSLSCPQSIRETEGEEFQLDQKEGGPKNRKFPKNSAASSQRQREGAKEAQKEVTGTEDGGTGSLTMTEGQRTTEGTQEREANWDHDQGLLAPSLQGRVDNRTFRNRQGWDQPSFLGQPWVLQGLGIKEDSSTEKPQEWTGMTSVSRQEDRAEETLQEVVKESLPQGGSEDISQPPSKPESARSRNLVISGKEVDPRYELQLAKEQAQHWEQLLQAQERELQTLREQLSRCEVERARLQMMLEQKQQEAERRDAMYEKELEGQRDLVRAMKRRVLELIHEKDHQWQRLQQLSAVAAGHCVDCNKVFRRLSRRYPCRLCGGLVCHACSADYKKREHCCPACAQREEIQIS